MTDLRFPCREGDPEDWFIDRHGKQYADEDLLTDDDRLAILEQANEAGLEGDERIAFIEKTHDKAEAEARTKALQRRRQAKQDCHTDCLFRTNCLDMALRGDHQHGTWGGYYEEELREIRREIARRKRARKGN